MYFPEWTLIDDLIGFCCIGWIPAPDKLDLYLSVFLLISDFSSGGLSVGLNTSGLIVLSAWWPTFIVIFLWSSLKSQ